MGAEGGKRLAEWGWLVFWLAVSSLWCVSASARLGATFDEPTYVSLGLESWRTGTSRRLLDLGTMPLPCHVQTLPLYLWERWREKPFDLEQDLSRLLPLARLGALPFWWLLLVYGRRAGGELAGVWGGRLAVAFLAVEPNLLGHAGLATTDIAVTAALLVLLVHFRAGRGGGWWRRVGLPTVCFTLTTLCKATGPAFALIALGALEVERRLAAMPGPTDWRGRLKAGLAALTDRGFRRDVTQMMWLGLVLTFLYCGTDWCVSPSFVKWAHDLPEGITKTGMVWLAEHLRIFSNAGMALVRQFRHNLQGHGVYLLDRVARRAIWYYFPVALSIKSTVPLLALPLLLIALCRKALCNWACLAALALLVFSLVCRVQIGIRFMLPLLSLAAIGLAAAVVHARQTLPPGWRRAVLGGGVTLACLWMAWTPVSVWPHGLCYTNELWGGTRNGYRCLSDSNYDWGQGLKDLARWQERHQARHLDVLYAGTDRAFLKQLPIRSLSVQSLHLDESGRLPMELQGHTLAVGTSLLFGSLCQDSEVQRALALLRRLSPVDRTATFLIYHFPTARSLAGEQEGELAQASCLQPPGRP
jgi:hypothetical protein